MSAAKSWLKRSLAASGILQLASRVASPGVAVLSYHSVMDEPQKQADTLGDIVHPTLVFCSQMELIARDFHPVSLDDAARFVQGNMKLPRRPVVVTFDDGYADNFEVAAPILNRLGIPATFYVTVGCIDTATAPWVSRLRHSFCRTRKPAWVDSAAKTWTLGSARERQHAFQTALEHCARITGDAREQLVNATERALEVEPLSSNENLMMTWDQTRQLVRQGHTVGSHSMTHPNLAHVEAEDLRFELEQSKQRLEQELGCPVVHFSYPCPALQPHWTARTVEVCRNLGYSTAVTSDSGPVREGDNLLSLHRVPPTAEVEGLSWNLSGTFLGRAV